MSADSVLLLHNYYQQAGGEDQVFTDETGLLEARGHRVLRYTVHNDALKGKHPLALAATTVWNRQVYRELRSFLRRERPRLAHFHNTFPLLSPAAYYAARAEGVPVVQTLHNYRLLCPNALFFRDRHPCEDCLGRSIPWPGVVHACYRGSHAASGVTATMLAAHRAMGTWQEAVDVYIATTQFARQKFIQGKLPADRIMLKPNFVYPDPGFGAGGGGYALFAGRLSPEKGVAMLLRAWRLLAGKVPLKIAGAGPLEGPVSEAVQQGSGIEWLGRVSDVYTLMREAAVLIFPSEVYEGLPKTIIEAFAVGIPIIAPDLGAMSTLISAGRTGLHFRPGDARDLAATVDRAWARPAELARMGREARREYEAEYTAERNYALLMEIYEAAIAHHRPRRSMGDRSRRV